MENFNLENNQTFTKKSISDDDKNIISEIYDDISKMMAEDGGNPSLEENNQTI